MLDIEKIRRDINILTVADLRLLVEDLAMELQAYRNKPVESAYRDSALPTNGVKESENVQE